MQKILNEIAELCSSATTEPTKTGLPRVLMIQGEVPTHQLAAVYEPLIGLVVQGGKTISIGTQVVHLEGPSYFVIPTEMPATGYVRQAANGRPYLSVALQLDQKVLLDLLKDTPNTVDGKNNHNEFSSCPATAPFLEVWLRMLRLMKTPEHIAALAPLYRKRNFISCVDWAGGMASSAIISFPSKRIEYSPSYPMGQAKFYKYF